jgi:hypothetical protein
VMATEIAMRNLTARRSSRVIRPFPRQAGHVYENPPCGSSATPVPRQRRHALLPSEAGAGLRSLSSNA